MLVVMPVMLLMFVLSLHGLSSKKMALITSDYGTMRSLSIRVP